MLNTLIIGSGFSGINLAVDLLRRGDESFAIVDRGSGFGGTWRDNTYPGAECDIQSHLYSFSFHLNPNWSKTYAPQPEILDYLVDVTRTWGLERFARFGEEVLKADFDQERLAWTVETNSGMYECRNLALCTGHLADPKLPDVGGAEEFSGQIFHSAQWNHNLDLSGKRVAVVGTGASAIQVVPALAAQGIDLTVFQRSAPYVIPRVDNVYSDAQKRKFARAPETARAFREFLFWSNESRFLQRMMVEPDLTAMSDIASAHRKRQLGGHRELLESVTPNYTIGCKRILLSNTWYPALAQDNVHLVASGVDTFTCSGVVDAAGDEHDFDVIIMCSGFEAQNLLIADRVSNGEGIRLAETWTNGSKAFGGMMVNGFPNLYIINGPHVGLGAGSIIAMIEVQSAYVAEAIDHGRQQSDQALQVSLAAEDEFFDHVQKRSQGTVWTSGGCRSWYLNPETGNLTAIWPDMMNRYRSRFADVDADDLEYVPAGAAAGGTGPVDERRRAAANA